MTEKDRSRENLRHSTDTHNELHRKIPQYVTLVSVLRLEAWIENRHRHVVGFIVFEPYFWLLMCARVMSTLRSTTDTIHMKCIIGRKLEMSQVFQEDGTVVPVTLIQAGPCTVTALKTADKDGYSAVQVGYGTRKHVNKAQAGQWKDMGSFSVVREFRMDDPSNYELGSTFDVTTFEAGDKIDVVGTSKGRGFQGVVKRHGFAGQNATHGTKDQVRMPGSIGATGPQRVFKGVRMPGQMGDKRVTVKNLEVVQVDPTRNVLAVKGAVPGARNGLVFIKTV